MSRASNRMGLLGTAALTAALGCSYAADVMAQVHVYDARDGRQLDVTVDTESDSAVGATAAWSVHAQGFQALRVARSALDQGRGGGFVTYADVDSSAIYLCPTGAVDSDGDSVCDAAEARYGTAADLTDTDGDGLSDTAELYGTFEDGLVYDIKALGANPNHRDLFLEVDYVDGFAPTPAVKEAVELAFASAPLANPDGTSGIHLLIEIADKPLPAGVVPDVFTEWSQLDTIKGNPAYFDPNRRLAFHYAIFGKRYGSATNTSSGLADALPGPNFVVTLEGWDWYTMTPDARQWAQAGTLMHELGHSLGLHHGGYVAGGSFEDGAYKPHYLSVMNYNYQTGVYIDGQPRLDYARYAMQGVSELSFFEPNAFQPANSNSITDLTHYSVLLCTRQGSQPQFSELLLGTASAQLDLNRNSKIDDNRRRRKDLNGNKRLESFKAIEDDWSHLNFSGLRSYQRPYTSMRFVVEDEEPCANKPDPQRAPNNEPDVDDDPTAEDPDAPQQPPVPQEPTTPSEPQIPEQPAPPAPNEPEEPGPWPNEPEEY